ncbi:MAG: type II toxin-antitoxin system ParD family antitoxin [Cyanobacteria bacterium P01_F01_bin.13]
MEITLKLEQIEFVQTQITKGRYSNADEVVSCALKLLQAWELEYEQWLGKTRSKVDVGLTQVQQGDVFELEAVTESLQAKIMNLLEY